MEGQAHIWLPIYYVPHFIRVPQTFLRGLKKHKSFFLFQSWRQGWCSPALALCDRGSEARGQGSPGSVGSDQGPRAPFTFPAGEGWGGVSSVSELPSLLPPRGGPVGAEHPLCGLLSGREDLLLGVAAAAEREASHRPWAEWGEGMETRCSFPDSPRTCSVCTDMPASIPAWWCLSIWGRGSSNLSLSLRLWSLPGAHTPRSLLSTT